MNMAFADLLLGPFSVPFYTYQVEHVYQLWTAKYSFYIMVFRCMNAIFVFGSYLSAAIISCERFNAVYWPFKRQLLSTKTLRIVIFILWTFVALLSKILTLLLLFTSFESTLYVTVAVLLGLTIFICVCSIGIWIKFQRKTVFSKHQNKASRSRPPTKTLLFVSILDLLYVGSLVTLNVLIDLTETSIAWKFQDMVNILNYFNSFVNPAVYAIRIPKVQQALCSCRKRGEQPLRRNRSKEEIERLHLERH